MTGTFDGWKKTEKLEKVGDRFEKLVKLNDVSEKIDYKVRNSRFPPVACPRALLFPCPLASRVPPPPSLPSLPPRPTRAANPQAAPGHSQPRIAKESANFGNADPRNLNARNRGA